ncbi:MAG: PAS domain S-box protein [Candidatus Odinarchaeota archaeon]
MHYLPSTAKETNSAFPVPERIKVLYVDDESDFLLLVTNYIEKINKQLEITSISDSSQALKLVKTSKGAFDVIVSDYQMPGLNGLELLEEIRKHDNDIPFIILTGKGREEVVIRALNIGADYYLQKASELRVLITELNNFIMKGAERKFLKEKHEETAEELRNSYELYNNILESITDGILALDKDFNYTHWNSTMERLYKTPKEVLLGKGPPWKFFPHIVEEGKDNMMKMAMEGNASSRDNMPYRLADGTAGFTSVKFMPLRDRNGEVRGIVEVITDVTEQKLKEEAIRQSEEKYRNLVETMWEGVLMADSNHNITFANKRMTEMTGYEIEEILGKTIMDLVHPVVRDRVKNELTSRFDGISNTYESILVTRDAKPVPALVSASPVFTEGKVTGGIAVITDLTQVKETEKKLLSTEERFRLMYEYAPIGYQSLDIMGRILDVNTKWLELLGYSREEVIGHEMTDFLTAEGIELIKKRFPEFKRTGEINDLYYDLKRKDGSILPVVYNGRVQYDKKGNFVRTHCVFQRRTR